MDEIEVKKEQVKTKARPIKDESALIRQYKEKFGELLDLTSEQIKRIKKTLKREISEWEEGTAGLRQNLKDWYDLTENIVEDKELPFDGAADVHVPVVRIFSKIYKTMERKSILGADNLWYAESDDPELEQFLPKIEEYFNMKARTDWNIKNFLSDIFPIVNRDSLAIGQIDYDIETERVEDVFSFSNVNQFAEELPTPESSGLSIQEWMEFARKAEMSSDEEPLEVPVEYDNIVYLGPKGHIVELADFLIFPATATDISRSNCRGYGKQFTMRKSELRRKADEGMYYSDEVDKLIKERTEGSDFTEYKRNKLFKQGLSRTGKSDEFLLNEVVYWFDMGNDGVERKFIFVYEKEKNVLLCAKYFVYRTNTWVMFYIDKKTGQLVGGCIPEELVDSNDEMDALHSQRFNSRKITEVPSFKGKKSAKTDFDPEAIQNRWRPGVIFWLEDPDSFNQFTVQPVDLGTSMQEEEKILRYCTLLMGIDPFISSGNAPVDDPSAPGNKTAMLIGQQNMRMEDPIEQLRNGVEEVGNILVALEYQFGPNIIEFNSKENKKNVKKSFPKRILRKGIKLNMHPITVSMNSESNFIRQFNIHKILLSEPMFVNSISRRIESLREVLKEGRVKNYDKFLPSPEEIEQTEVMLRAKAMQVVNQQKEQVQMKAEQEKQDQINQEVEARDAGKQQVVKAIEDKARGIKAVNNLVSAVTGGENGNSKTV